MVPETPQRSSNADTRSFAGILTSSSSDLTIVFSDIWDSCNMFNLGIITTDRTRRSIIASCNYLHIDHCRREGGHYGTCVCARRTFNQSTTSSRDESGTTTRLLYGPAAGDGLRNRPIGTRGSSQATFISLFTGKFCFCFLPVSLDLTLCLKQFLTMQGWF